MKLHEVAGNEPPEKELSFKGWIIISLILVPIFSLIIYSQWRVTYLSGGPVQIETTIASKIGVIHTSQYCTRSRCADKFYIVDRDGHQTVIGCEAFGFNGRNECLLPLIETGVARISEDGSFKSGHFVEVHYVRSDHDERFRNVVYSITLDGDDLLDSNRILDRAGISRDGRQYSKAVYLRARSRDVYGLDD